MFRSGDRVRAIRQAESWQYQIEMGRIYVVARVLDVYNDNQDLIMVDDLDSTGHPKCYNGRNFMPVSSSIKRNLPSWF
jgi:hypothetical protein